MNARNVIITNFARLHNSLKKTPVIKLNYNNYVALCKWCSRHVHVHVNKYNIFGLIKGPGSLLMASRCWANLLKPRLINLRGSKGSMLQYMSIICDSRKSNISVTILYPLINYMYLMGLGKRFKGSNLCLFAAPLKLPSKLHCRAHFNVRAHTLLQFKREVNNVGVLQES